jgi:hypothetical protein
MVNQFVHHFTKYTIPSLEKLFLEVSVKVKVKVSLCFNQAPRRKVVLGKWRYSSTHSLVSALNGGEWSASRSAALPQGRSPWYPLDRRLGGPQSRSGHGGEEKNSQSLPGIEP